MLVCRKNVKAALILMQVSMQRVRMIHASIEVAINFFLGIEDLTTLGTHVLPRFGLGGASTLNHLIH
jgi:hypothetical protein